MNTFILVGFDLVVSALLILLGMFVVWSRFRTQPEVDGNREITPTVKTVVKDNEVSGKPSVQFSVEEPDDEWAFGDVTQKAATLKKKGCSTEEIAHRLQIPTREVEMVLAISGMARPEKLDRGVTAAFPLSPEAARLV
jgi:hypothetical protein